MSNTHVQYFLLGFFTRIRKEDSLYIMCSSTVLCLLFRVKVDYSQYSVKSCMPPIFEIMCIYETSYHSFAPYHCRPCCHTF